MDRPDRRMTTTDAWRILQQGKYGILSTASSDGLPYGVPVNYVYSPDDNAIYIHCFIRGRKLDNIRENPRVSFLVIGQAELMPERFITHYESAIISGRATLITDDAEKRARLLQLCQELAPASLSRRDEVIERQVAAVTFIRIGIDAISGKRNRDE